MKIQDQKGIAHLLVIAGVVLLTAVTGVSVRVYQASKEKATRELASQKEAANKASQEALEDQSQQEAEKLTEDAEASTAPASSAPASTTKPKAAAPKAAAPAPAPAAPTVENKPDSSNCNMNALYHSNASGFTATKDAATGSPAVFTVPGYTLVSASECTYNSNWRKVVYNGQTGYTHKDNVQISE